MSQILTAQVDGVELEPADYSSVATAGDPKAKMAKLCTSEAGWASTVGIWTCEPCTIVSEVKIEETILVLGGEVRIELDDGSAVDLGVGDIAVLPRGKVATWTVKTPYKELFMLTGTATS
jgi:uncharacterized protein